MAGGEEGAPRRIGRSLRRSGRDDGTGARAPFTRRFEYARARARARYGTDLRHRPRRGAAAGDSLPARRGPASRARRLASSSLLSTEPPEGLPQAGPGPSPGVAQGEQQGCLEPRAETERRSGDVGYCAGVRRPGPIPTWQPAAALRRVWGFAGQRDGDRLRGTFGSGTEFSVEPGLPGRRRQTGNRAGCASTAGLGATRRDARKIPTAHPRDHPRSWGSRKGRTYSSVKLG